MFKRSVLLAIVALQLGCVSKMLSKAIPQEGKEPEKVRTVKRVAIVGYDTLEYQPSGLGSSVIPMLGTAQSTSNLVPVESELSLQLYNDLLEELKRQGFQVLPLSKVRTNSYYQNLVKNMSDVASKLKLNETQKPTQVKGIARAVNPKYQFTDEQRNQLAKELGVDAVVFARVAYFATSDTDYLGLGLSKSYLAPVFSFYMFGGEKSELIWFALQHAGPKSEESLGRVSGLEDKGVIAKMSRPLARQAMRSFLSKTSFNQ
jgi:hypothetical protein